MSKDYSLLRPFDLEKAKQGEPICWYLNSMVVLFVGISINKEVVYKNQDDFICFTNADKIKMAPLCWLEDKPVYKGDILYRKLPGTNEIQELTVQSIEKCTEDPFIRFEQENQAEYADNRRKNLSWTKPKQKKQGWINVYPARYCYWWTSKEEADSAARRHRISCVPFEYEE